MIVETGKWGNFNDWSACSVTCGEGYRFRKRECFSSTEANKKIIPSDNCIGKNIEIQPCDITTCPGRDFPRKIAVLKYRGFFSSLWTMDILDTMFNFLWNWYQTA